MSEYDYDNDQPRRGDRRELRGFDSLRTRPSEANQAAQARRCSVCGSILSRYNSSNVCRPCSCGEVEIPEWVSALLDQTDKNNIRMLANILRRDMQRTGSLSKAIAELEAELMRIPQDAPSNDTPPASSCDLPESK